jgi:hypothetical protein
LALSIWNDPRGGYAFIRGNKRYGHYLDPVEPHDFYYAHTVRDLDLENQNMPMWFMQVVKPLGWNIPTTPDGEQKKWNQKDIIDKEGPFEELPEA